MHYGNQNTKRFMLIVILVLFIGGFIKGMWNANNKTTHIVEQEQTNSAETIGK